jgi:ADP-ribose pyrophosphatase YjhB (NUDIX family)
VNVTRVAAYALVRDDEDRLLLVRIAPGYPAAGAWTLPGGGIQFGEDPHDAVVREVAEESGLEGVVTGLAFVHSGTGPSLEGGRWHGIRIVFEVNAVGGDLRDEVDESTDSAAWFSLAEARRLPVVDLVGVALDWLERTSED